MTTNDQPENLILHPDWSEGIAVSFVYRTDIERSRSGLEQRSRRRRRAIQAIEYQFQDLHDEASLQALEIMMRTTRRPLLSPWWNQTNLLLVTMDSDAATLEVSPNESDWKEAPSVYLWSRFQGGQVRKIESIQDQIVRLEPDTEAIFFEKGSFIAPMRKCVREMGDDLMGGAAQRTATQTVRLRTI